MYPLIHPPSYQLIHLYIYPRTGLCSQIPSDLPNLPWCYSVTKLCPTLCDPWTAAHQASMSFTISQSMLKLMFIESVMPSNHLILCHPLLLPPSIFPSIRVFSNESVLPIRWPKYWSFHFSISPSNEYSGLISFRMDWFDLFADQGTLRSLRQHHSSKASILWCSAFFTVQLSHPYMTTGKTLTIQTFISKESIAFYVSTITIEMWIYVKNSTIWRIILRENI